MAFPRTAPLCPRPVSQPRSSGAPCSSGTLPAPFLWTIPAPLEKPGCSVGMAQWGSRLGQRGRQGVSSCGSSHHPH
ncbi:hypothetical protein DV515_00000853 [Chloebia gouldiae]|uniref:Uncharacterized protein n=1 Tax=Chloebia gouldiae TaxID=44316 RepID=A0A3L8SZ94_CHLGU|nr:hypothetical protein DV515_00000853 [Chloebia gouldiae]